LSTVFRTAAFTLALRLAAIVPGKSPQSPLYKAVAQEGELRMAPGSN
jgi:hypothetical protein